MVWKEKDPDGDKRKKKQADMGRNRERSLGFINMRCLQHNCCDMLYFCLYQRVCTF